MTMSLEGRVALVTGSGRGIGRAIALGLAEDGADVAIHYRRDETAAKQTVADIEALGRHASAYRGSIESWEDDQAVVESVLADFGPVDILINNAGIASRGQSVADTDPAELERVVRTHAFGSHFMCKLILPGMRQCDRGDIVMISSAATLNHAANGAPYNMAKAAMESLAFTLYKEERGNGIHVNIVAPGLVETEMGKRLMKATAGITDMRELDRHMPFERVCQPEDIATVVRFLVSDAASYMTGEKLNVHGGGQS